MTIRSARLLTFFSTTGPAQSPAYSSRAGYTTIVKSVHVQNAASTTATVQVIANTSTSIAVAVLSADIDQHGLAFRDAAAKIASVDTLESFMKDFSSRKSGAKI